jgi:uncharacterized integral membrane protein
MYDYWKTLSPIDKIKFTFNVLLGIVGVVFATLNWHSQEIHLVFFKAKLPLTLLIIFSMIVGYAISTLFNLKKFQVKDDKIENLESELKAVKKELEDLQ